MARAASPALWRVFSGYKLAMGETATVLTLAVNQDQARVVMNYAGGFIAASPMLSQRLGGEPTSEEIRLTGNVVIRAGLATAGAVALATLRLNLACRRLSRHAFAFTPLRWRFVGPAFELRDGVVVTGLGEAFNLHLGDAESVDEIL